MCASCVQAACKQHVKPRRRPTELQRRVLLLARWLSLRVRHILVSAQTWEKKAGLQWVIWLPPRHQHRSRTHLETASGWQTSKQSQLQKPSPVASPASCATSTPARPFSLHCSYSQDTGYRPSLIGNVFPCPPPPPTTYCILLSLLLASFLHLPCIFFSFPFFFLLHSSFVLPPPPLAETQQQTLS